MISFSDETIKIIDYISSKFGIAIDWGNDNLIPILQELAAKYITWEICTSVMWIILGIILLIPGFMLVKKAIKQKDFDDIMSYCFLSLFLLAPAFLIIFCQSYDIIKCITFPELQIFGYLSDLIKNMK